jgi:hypothetical protein
MDYKSIYLAKRNPSVAPEDWPRHWRSHPKALANLPMVRAAINKLSYCAQVREPKLDGAPFNPPGASREYDGAAVVSSKTQELHNTDWPDDVREIVLADERRVFASEVDKFTMRCRESLVLGDVRGPAAVIRFLSRKPGVSREAFIADWNAADTKAAEQAVSAGKATRYVHNAVVEEPPPGYPFDGISETWFTSLDEATRAFVDPALTPLTVAQPGACDPSRTVTLLTEVIYRLPRE